MPPVSSASLPHAQSVNVGVPNVAQAPSGNGANVPEAASGQAPTTRHQAHSMFVEAPPTCANGWTEDPFGNCIPPTGGGGGVIGPVCPYNCGGTGGSGGSGGCITNPNALGCGGGPIAHTNGPAQYNDQCTNAAEQIGHPVPGLDPTDANRITDEYPVESGNFLVGYAYTTWGTSGNNGTAYFLAVGSVGAGVTVNSSLALPIGSDAFVEGSSAGSFLATLAKFVTNGAVPELKEPCFTSRWNGTYPG